MKKPKVYLCARVSDDAHEINNKIVDLLSPYFTVFAPHKKEAELKQPKDPVEIFNLDIEGMDAADICVTIAPYGKDCSWEMGFFAGQKKPIFMYVPDIESLPGKEWMISGGTTVILTDNVATSISANKLGFGWVVLCVPSQCLGLALSRYYNNGGR